MSSSKIAKDIARIGRTDVEGVMMILSPAKTLDLSPYKPPSGKSFPAPTDPSCDSAKTTAVAVAMKARKEKDLEKLLKISSNLAKTSRKYWVDFKPDPSDRVDGGKKPALFAFSGAAYQGLEAPTLSERAVGYLQSNLRIVDPLYGSLRPMDLIQPYRLEMATKGALAKGEMGDAKDLARGWRASVTESIGADLGGREVGSRLVANLASDEYSAAIDPLSLPKGTAYVKVVFQQEGRVISVHAKRARGLMVRYIAENQVEDIEGMRRFDSEGYRFVKGRSEENHLVFDRPKQTPMKGKKKAITTISGGVASSQKKRARQKR